MRGMILAAAIVMVAGAQQQKSVYQVGDRVEAYDVGWYKGVVTQVGTGNYAGYYMVKYDDFSTNRYFKPGDLRPGGPPAAPKQYPAYKIGDSVEGYDFGWHPAVVKEIRQGERGPEYLLQYTKFSSSRWYKPADMRAAGVGEAEAAQNSAAAAGGPRPGKYLIYSYGAVGAPPLFLGHFELLGGGKYRISRTSGEPYYGEGTYRFDAAGSVVQWLTGPLATADWTGKFSVEGQRHRIGLKARTVATNSAQ